MVTWRFAFNCLVKFMWISIAIFFAKLFASLRETKLRRLSGYCIDIWIVSIEVVHWEIFLSFLLNFPSHVTSSPFWVFSWYLIISWARFISIFSIILVYFHSKRISMLIWSIKISGRTVRTWRKVILWFIGVLFMITFLFRFVEFCTHFGFCIWNVISSRT